MLFASQGSVVHARTYVIKKSASGELTFAKICTPFQELLSAAEKMGMRLPIEVCLDICTVKVDDVLY
jgi:hypothetical protein